MRLYFIIGFDIKGVAQLIPLSYPNRKVNLVNHRREFFYATLDEIKAVVMKNYDKTDKSLHKQLLKENDGFYAGTSVNVVT